MSRQPTRTVHWCEASVDALAGWDDQFARWLHANEQARAARFHREVDARRHRRAHGLLRGLLGRAIGADPAALSFVDAPGGKPALWPPSPWRFNLSHAGDRVLVAWAWDIEVGADIEQVRPGIGREGLGERFFHPLEAAAVQASSSPDDTFITLWSRKEAVLKAWGDGLAVDLHRFEVASPAGHGTVTAPPDTAAARHAWWWCDLGVAGPYRAAVAGDGLPATLQHSAWP
ncbi:4'-phosphopantetheinyl transferase superfamily protein [Ideonella sp. DXS22W]|uniref:4'-phosphopantetheinyl transferase superfamily protein n=1 Tax=Pseudaquabacterium inlustre TaxID=2984192 RepID=A0ABU9CH06_9BURK